MELVIILIPVLLISLGPIVAFEVGLLFLRRRRSIGWGYVFFSAFIRTLIYAPCIAGGHGAIPISTFFGVLVHLVTVLVRNHGFRVLFFYGIPQLVVFGIALICSWIWNRKYLKRYADHVA